MNSQAIGFHYHYQTHVFCLQTFFSLCTQCNPYYIIHYTLYNGTVIIRAKIIFDLSPPPMIKCEKSPFYLCTLQKVIFCSGCKYFFILAAIFCLLKNYNPMQKMVWVVIDVYKFVQKMFTIGIFWIFLYKYLKKIPVKAA